MGKQDWKKKHEERAVRLLAERLGWEVMRFSRPDDDPPDLLVHLADGRVIGVEESQVVLQPRRSLFILRKRLEKATVRRLQQMGFDCKVDIQLSGGLGIGPRDDAEYLEHAIGDLSEAVAGALVEHLTRQDSTLRRTHYIEDLLPEHDDAEWLLSTVWVNDPNPPQTSPPLIVGSNTDDWLSQCAQSTYNKAVGLNRWPHQVDARWLLLTFNVAEPGKAGFDHNWVTPLAHARARQELRCEGFDAVAVMSMQGSHLIPGEQPEITLTVIEKQQYAESPPTC